MSSLFHEILYRPLLNALVFLYQTIALNDLGLAIILLTIVVRVVLFPFFYKGFRNQTILQRLQPEIKKIQHDHGHNRELQARALMELYRTHRVNPFSSFVLILVQLPILIALYRVFSKGIALVRAEDLYAFIAAPSRFENSFLHLINLQNPNILIVGFAALAQYFQGRLALGRRGEAGADRMARQMTFMGPALTLFFLFSLPAAIGLYWLVSSLFSLVQQVLIQRSLAKNPSPYGTGTVSQSDHKTI